MEKPARAVPFFRLYPVGKFRDIHGGRASGNQQNSCVAQFQVEVVGRYSLELSHGDTQVFF